MYCVRRDEILICTHVLLCIRLIIRIFALGTGSYRSFKLMKRNSDMSRGLKVSSRTYFVEDTEESILMFWYAKKGKEGISRFVRRFES